MKKIILLIISVLLLFVFFTYKLTSVPSGVTVDESAFGYNAILLSKTLHDENHRFLPMFALSIHGTDWRQPVTQYFSTAMFKIFDPSLFNLRLTAVITVIISILLIYFLGKKILGERGGIMAAIFLATTPIIMIQSHLGLDNIAPVPFVIIWVLGLMFFSRQKKSIWLIISAVSLGIGFYSYKGMRVYVPVWIILSFIYLAESFFTKPSKKTFTEAVKPFLTFGLAILPFFAIIPYLESRYAGAVLSGQHPVFEGVYKFAYPFLASFDPSFLWVKGDSILIHSTGMHGMYLLATIPFFIAGLAYVWKKDFIWKLIIASFFLGPLLFGFFGSVDRASRMLAEVPLYSLISAAGFIYFWGLKNKILAVIFSILFLFNYFDFIHYYLTNYAKDTANLFYCFNCADAEYKKLKEESVNRNLVPYVDSVVAKREDTTYDFARTIYFLNPPSIWDGKREDLPKDAILMTDNDSLNYLKLIGREENLFYYTY